MNNQEHYQKYKDGILRNKREYYKRNRKQILEQQYRKYWSDPLKDHGKKIKKRYGLNREDYAKLLEKQKGVCAICKQAPDKRRLAVDHCHITNKVRGLLCINCNKMLGHAKDNVNIMQDGINYLRMALGTGASDMLTDE